MPLKRQKSSRSTFSYPARQKNLAKQTPNHFHSYFSLFKQNNMGREVETRKLSKSTPIASTATHILPLILFEMPETYYHDTPALIHFVDCIRFATCPLITIWSSQNLYRPHGYSQPPLQGYIPLSPHGELSSYAFTSIPVSDFLYRSQDNLYSCLFSSVNSASINCTSPHGPVCNSLRVKKRAPYMVHPLKKGTFFFGKHVHALCIVASHGFNLCDEDLRLLDRLSLKSLLNNFQFFLQHSSFESQQRDQNRPVICPLEGSSILRFVLGYKDTDLFLSAAQLPTQFDCIPDEYDESGAIFSQILPDSSLCADIFVGHDLWANSYLRTPYRFSCPLALQNSSCTGHSNNNWDSHTKAPIQSIEGGGTFASFTRLEKMPRIPTNKGIKKVRTNRPRRNSRRKSSRNIVPYRKRFRKRKKNLSHDDRIGINVDNAASSKTFSVPQKSITPGSFCCSFDRQEHDYKIYQEVLPKVDSCPDFLSNQSLRFMNQLLRSSTCELLSSTCTGLQDFSPRPWEDVCHNVSLGKSKKEFPNKKNKFNTERKGSTPPGRGCSPVDHGTPETRFLYFKSKSLSKLYSIDYALAQSNGLPIV